MAQSRLGQNAILVPIGTTAERPSSPEAGEIRFNTDLDTFEGYDGFSWGSIGRGTESQNISFDDSAVLFTAADVQAAIEKASEAENTSYDNTESGLAADNVQGAVDEVTGALGTMADQDADNVAITGGSASVSTAAVTDTTDATSIADAPLKTAGGLAVAKGAYFGGDINLFGTTQRIGLTPPSRLDPNTQWRISLTFDTNLTFAIYLRFSGRGGGGGSRNGQCFKLLTGFMRDFRFEETENEVFFQRYFLDSDVVIEHTGANSVADLIIKHPTHSISREFTFSRLDLEITRSEGIGVTNITSIIENT